MHTEIQISGQSNGTQCCQQLATAATFFRKKQCCRAQEHEDGSHQLVTCLGVLQRVPGVQIFVEHWGR